MSFGRRVGVRSPNLDGLVSLAHDQAQAGLIKCGAHDASFSIERARLGEGLGGLEAMAGLPIPERDAPVIAATEEDVIFIDGEGVDDGVVAVEVLHEGTLGAFPLLDGARGA